MARENKQDELRLQYFESLKNDILESLPKSFVEENDKWRRGMEEVNTLIAILDDTKSVKSRTKDDFKVYKYDDFCQSVMRVYKNFFDFDNIKIDSLFLSEKEFKEIESQSKSDREIDEKTHLLLKQKLNRNLYIPLEQYLIKETIKERIPAELSGEIENNIKSVNNELDN